MRKKAVEQHKWAIEMTAIMGGEVMAGPFHSPLAVFSGDPPTEDEKKRCVEVMQQSAEVAKQHKVLLTIEYLNRFECYFLTTAAQAKDLVQKVNHPNFKTMYDTFHANIEEKNPIAAIDTVFASGKLNHVLISENDRGTPGRGHINITEQIQHLKKIGYNGWMTIEAFGGALPDLAAATRVWRDFFPSTEQVYEEGIALIRRAWNA